MATDIEKIISEARNAFNRKVTRSVNFRINQLRKLAACIDDNYDEFLTALKEDLNKPKLESIIAELNFVKNDIKFQLEHIHEHMKPKRVSKGIANFFDDAYVKYDPLGVVLVLSAWNYPFQILLSPVVGAIAAGNCVVIKPSEVSSQCEKAIAKFLPKYLDNECYPVITGGVEVSTRLLQQKFDLIFFTGSQHIGKIIYEAAAKHLTPVVLELGGKSPAYIDDSVSGDMDVAVRRILWGKLANCGQTCIAPDYLMCTPQVQQRFMQVSKKVLNEFFAAGAKESDSYGRIVNDRNFDRLQTLLNGTAGTVTIGGDVEKGERYIAPTIVENVTLSDSLMTQEIFGPILPIINVQSDDEAIELINRGEKPLTMYLFSNKKKVVDKFLEQTSSGSVCINDTIMQLFVHGLPFGGVGNSGIGKYHGTFSFETFSHSKAILARNYNLIGERLAKTRYPPYNEKNIKILKFLASSNNLENIHFGKLILGMVLFASVVCVAMYFLYGTGHSSK